MNKEILMLLTLSVSAANLTFASDSHQSHCAYTTEAQASEVEQNTTENDSPSAKEESLPEQRKPSALLRLDYRPY